jgi:hypothetical protein
LSTNRTTGGGVVAVERRSKGRVGKPATTRWPVTYDQWLEQPYEDFYSRGGPTCTVRMHVGRPVPVVADDVGDVDGWVEVHVEVAVYDGAFDEAYTVAAPHYSIALREEECSHAEYLAAECEVAEVEDARARHEESMWGDW